MKTLVLAVVLAVTPALAQTPCIEDERGLDCCPNPNGVVVCPAFDPYHTEAKPLAKTDVVKILHPYNGRAMGLAPLEVGIRLVIRRPDKLYCPEITVDWPDGTRSSYQEDCDPLPDGAVGDDYYWPDRDPITRVFLEPTRVIIRIKGRGGEAKAEIFIDAKGM